jgi:LacI family transcriptional regulator
MQSLNVEHLLLNGGLLMAVVLKDIAKRAGVSITTVSRVLNKQAGSIPISAGTVEKVRTIAQELGYTPNLAARQLVTGKSNVIVILLDKFNMLSTHVNSHILQGIGNELSREGYRIELIDSRLVGEDHHCFFTELVNGFKIDGVMLWNCFEDEETVSILKDLKVPYCYIQWSSPYDQVPSVISDNYKGGYLATKHLCLLGHTNIGFVGPNDYKEAILRYDGYADALIEEGIPVNNELFINASFYQEHIIGLVELSKLEETLTSVTGLVCASDYLALGVIQFVISKGLKVPEDLAVVGFDDITLATSVFPQLTTVHQYGETIGETGVNVLLEQIEGKDDLNKVNLIDVKLIIRGSTAK